MLQLPDDQELSPPEVKIADHEALFFPFGLRTSLCWPNISPSNPPFPFVEAGVHRNRYLKQSSGSSCDYLVAITFAAGFWSVSCRLPSPLGALSLRAAPFFTRLHCLS